MKLTEAAVTIVGFGTVPVAVATDENELVLGVVQAVNVSE